MAVRTPNPLCTHYIQLTTLTSLHFNLLWLMEKRQHLEGKFNLNTDRESGIPSFCDTWKNKDLPFERPAGSLLFYKSLVEDRSKYEKLIFSRDDVSSEGSGDGEQFSDVKNAHQKVHKDESGNRHNNYSTADHLSEDSIGSASDLNALNEEYNLGDNKSDQKKRAETETISECITCGSSVYHAECESLATREDLVKGRRNKVITQCKMDSVLQENPEHDLLFGHQYGERPLLSDDELDTEIDAELRGSHVKVCSDNPEKIWNNSVEPDSLDIFSMAPFQKPLHLVHNNDQGNQDIPTHHHYHSQPASQAVSPRDVSTDVYKSSPLLCSISSLHPQSSEPVIEINFSDGNNDNLSTGSFSLTDPKDIESAALCKNENTYQSSPIECHSIPKCSVYTGIKYTVSQSVNSVQTNLKVDQLSKPNFENIQCANISFRSSPYVSSSTNPFNDENYISESIAPVDMTPHVSVNLSHNFSHQSQMICPSVAAVSPNLIQVTSFDEKPTYLENRAEKNIQSEDLFGSVPFNKITEQMVITTDDSHFQNIQPQRLAMLNSENTELSLGVSSQLGSTPISSSYHKDYIGKKNALGKINNFPEHSDFVLPYDPIQDPPSKILEKDTSDIIDRDYSPVNVTQKERTKVSNKSKYKLMDDQEVVSKVHHKVLTSKLSGKSGKSSSTAIKKSSKSVTEKKFKASEVGFSNMSFEDFSSDDGTSLPADQATVPFEVIRGEKQQFQNEKKFGSLKKHSNPFS